MINWSPVYYELDETIDIQSSVCVLSQVCPKFKNTIHVHAK